jgi:hypothetical protein
LDNWANDKNVVSKNEIEHDDAFLAAEEVE